MPRGKPATKPTRINTPKQDKIIQTKTAHPKLTTREIAAIAETDHSYVVQVLQRYNIEQKRVTDYKSNRADIFAGIQDRILSSITDEDIQKTPLGSRTLAVAQLYDKERLERGQSTGNLAVIQSDIQSIKQSKLHRDNDNDSEPIDIGID